MAKPKTDLKNLNQQDLKTRISEEELRLKRMHFSHGISPVENPMNIRSLRRELARLKTELRKRELGINPSISQL